jgi:hypothetical protein
MNPLTTHRSARLSESLLYAAVITAVGALIFFATVGALFLYATTPNHTSTMTCDRISQIDGEYWCMGKMASPSDKISITRQLP